MRKWILWLVGVILLLPGPGLADDSLSARDREVIRFCQDLGLVPPGWDERSVTPDEMRMLRAILHERFGTDDVQDIRRPDPRLASPETTWRTYRDALISGDVQAVKDCLSPRFARQHVAMFEALGPEKMSEVARDMQPIQKIVRRERHAKYRIKRMEKGQEITYYVYFVKMFHNWKIDRY